MEETEIGVVEHYFDRIGVVAIALTQGSLAVGDTIRIKGHTSDATATVQAIQIEHASVQSAGKGDKIGVKIASKVREHDKVYRVIA